MKILSTQQIKLADQTTINNEPILSIDLMERASLQFVSHFCNDYQSTSWVKHIFCGNGNNGGDGLAIARLLHKTGHPVIVYIIDSTKKFSNDAAINYERLEKETSVKIVFFKSINDLPVFHKRDVIIDALLGSGLNKPLDGKLLEVVQYLNQSQGIKVSVDIPSGLFADTHTPGEAFEANRVYTFQSPKLAFLLPQNGKYVQRFKVLDIKLDTEFLDSISCQYFFTEQKDIQAFYKPREKFTHKGTFGHALMIAGSIGKVGAAILASKSTLRSGAGLVTTHIPEVGYPFLQTCFPEAMCSIDPHSNFWTEMPDIAPYDAIGIGPGIGTATVTKRALTDFLNSNQKPLVLDADALNIIATNKDLLKHLPVDCIFTPHPKEFQRLAGTWENDFERLEIQRAFSVKHNLIIVLKGAHTSISDPDGNIYFNSTGNSGMATGGSGDVLTGILTGLLAQGYNAKEAALLGVYIHGLAGNLALEEQSKESLIASDLIGYLGKAFRRLHQI